MSVAARAEGFDMFYGSEHPFHPSEIDDFIAMSDELSLEQIVRFSGHLDGWSVEKLKAKQDIAKTLEQLAEDAAIHLPETAAEKLLLEVLAVARMHRLFRLTYRLWRRSAKFDISLAGWMNRTTIALSRSAAIDYLIDARYA